MTPLEYGVWFLVILVVTLIAIGVVNRRWPRLLQSEFPDKVAKQVNELALKEEVAKLTTQMGDVKRELDDAKTTVRVLSDALDTANGRIAAQNLQLATQTNQINNMGKEIEDLQRELGRLKPANANKTKKRIDGRVLAVWPEPTLDLVSVKAAIAKTGLDFDVLEGEHATKMGVLDQLSQYPNYRLFQIDAKGAESGIKLHDGMTSPRWWLKLAQQHEIDTFVVLANESAKPGAINVADALFTGGAKAVVSVSASINDEEAVQFAIMFYRRLATGVTLKQAVDSARLVINDASADVINLRER